VARAGAGIVIREEEYSPEAARAGVFELLSSPAYRQAALGVQSEIAAMPAAVDVLPRMLEEATSAGAARAAG
jgi:UDP:flavonoid glycosyltransferase YjiC (YdhE family)